MNGWSKIGLPLTALTAIGLGFFGLTTTSSITACSSSSSSSSGGSSGSGSGGASGGACPSPLGAGNFAPADCVTSDESTCAPTTCAIDTTKCGSTSTCEPLADNSGKTVQDFRIRRLTIIAPSSLANQIVQDSVVTLGVNLNAPACGSKGDGSFSWMVRLDTAAGTVTTGGAPPASDPFGVGYCFVKTKTTDGVDIAPVTVPVTKAADGTYESATLNSLNIPIYYQPGPSQQIIVLPINGGAIKGMKVTDNGNCIGSFNPQAINSQCYEANANSCAAWHTGGSLAGYITLEQADAVRVPLLQNHSLCVLLTGTAADPKTGACVRDASNKIVTAGAPSQPDFCSTTNSAGGCKDSYWLAATFAASAAKITDGAGVADCQGSTQPGPADGGSD